MPNRVRVHYKFWLNERLEPLVEVNWYHVFGSGDGRVVPAAAQFGRWRFDQLGGDRERAGFRVKVAINVHLAATLEFPLTHNEDNLMENRIKVDLVWAF